MLSPPPCSLSGYAFVCLHVCLTIRVSALFPKINLVSDIYVYSYVSRNYLAMPNVETISICVAVVYVVNA